MNVWGITDRGKIREQNQDAFAHQVLPDGRVIALVCDGMGGARAGNIASSMAVDVFMEAFLEDGEEPPPWPTGRSSGGRWRMRTAWAWAPPWWPPWPERRRP